MSGEPVKVYLYDLSQGMAKQMSMSLTGKQIDGIWHTSIVVYGQEFYFGQGISVDRPGATHHGQPVEIIDMGMTFLPVEVFMEYIDSQRSVYTAEKYHLLDFNCNTFSNDVCQFLTGASIPNHITDLPAEFLRTPFGQSLLPMIENMFGQSNLRSTPSTSTNGIPPATPTPNAETLAMLQGVSSAALSGAPASSISQQSVQRADNLATLDRSINTYTAVAVFFTSASCPPCRVIKPEFEQLIKDKNQTNTASLRLLGVIVDTSIAFDAGAKYQVRATPTFMFFHKGQKVSEFRGANYAELKSSVDLLLFTAYPPHPHRTLHLRQVCNATNAPILYDNIGKLDLISGKLLTYLKEDGIDMTEQQTKTLDTAKKTLIEKQHGILNMDDWQNLIDTLLQKLTVEHQFPLLDIFRSLALTKDAGHYYTTNCTGVAQLMDTVQNEEAKGIHTPKATWMMILRLACNLFTHHVLITTYFTTSHLESSSHRHQLTQLLVTSLLAQDTQVRQTAASLAFNCSTIIMADRLQKEEETGSLGSGDDDDDDDWHVEIMSAVMDALVKETDQDITHRLLASIGKFLFLAPTDSALPDLLSALDISGVLDDKKKKAIITTTPVLELARDINLMVEKSVGGK